MYVKNKILMKISVVKKTRSVPNFIKTGFYVARASKIFARCLPNDSFVTQQVLFEKCLQRLKTTLF